MKKKLIALSSLGLVSPLLTLAANNNCASVQGGTIEAIICKIGGILNTLIPIIVVLGVVYLIWGVIGYVIGNDEEAKKRGKDKIIFGIIGLVVIVALWGLVGIVTNTFGLNGNVNVPNVPCVPGTPGC